MSLTSSTKPELKSKESFYQAAQGKFVLRTLIGAPAIEDWDNMIANVRSQVLDQGGAESDIEVTDTAINLSSGQFILKPKSRREERVFVANHSTYLSFERPDGTTSRVDKKNLYIDPENPGALFLDILSGGKFKYEII